MYIILNFTPPHQILIIANAQDPVQRDAGKLCLLNIIKQKKKDSPISKIFSPLCVEFYAD